MKHKVQKHTIKVLAVLGVVILTVSLMSFGIRHNDHSKRKANHDIEKSEKYLIKKLDLTEAQAEQVKVILQKMYNQEDAITKSHSELENNLLEQFQNADFNQNELSDIIQNSLKNAENSAGILTQNLSELHALLNEEQRGELVNLMQKKHKK